jgi:hypothetical protein
MAGDEPKPCHASRLARDRASMQARDRQRRRARFSVPRRRATADSGDTRRPEAFFVRLRRAVQSRHHRVSLLILKLSLLILNGGVRNDALSWSPVTESNRRPSPYHGRSLRPRGSRWSRQCRSGALSRLAGSGCQRRPNVDPVAAGWFLLTVATLPMIIRGCAVYSSGEEGGGAASAVGQAPAVHGVAQPRVEHHGGGPGGRGRPDDGP